MQRSAELCALSLLAFSATWCSAQAPQALIKSDPPQSVPKDKAILDIHVPPGAKVTIDGQVPSKLKWTYHDMAPGKRVELDIAATFADGGSVRRKVFLQGGWDVRVPLRPSSRDRLEMVVQTGHVFPVCSVSFSPDGRYVLTGAWDHTAILWDASTGQKLRAYQWHTMAVSSASFSPDGKRIVTASWDKTATLWDASSGHKLHTFPLQHTQFVSCACFSRDGRQILTGAWDNTAVLWDAQTGQKLRTFRHADWVHSVAFSPNGQQVLTGSLDKTAAIWDVASGQKLRSLDGHTGSVNWACFSGDGTRIATASHDKTAGLWDAATGRKLRSFDGHMNWVMSVSFSPDGAKVVTGSTDKTAVLWDAESGRQLQVFKGHRGDVFSVCFGPDGRHVLTGAADHTAVLWDAGTGQKLRDFKGHAGAVSEVCFSPDDRHILTAISRKTLIWDMLSTPKPRPLEGHTRDVRAQRFSPDGLKVLTGSYDKTAALWDVASGQKVRYFQGQAEIAAVDFSPDGRWVLTGSWDKTATLWDVTTAQKLRSFSGHTDWVTTVCFSPDSRQVLTGSYDNTAILWDASTGQKLRSFVGHRKKIQSACFSPDGRHVLTGAWDKTACLWEARTGKKLRTCDVSDEVDAVDFSPDGHWILTASRDRLVALWETATGRKLRTFEGHTSPVLSACFSSDGRKVLSGSFDASSRLWDVATGDELARLISIDAGREWLVTSPEGLFDGSAAGRDKVSWRIGKELRVVAVDRFFQDFYRPGLLAAVMRGDRPMASSQLGKNPAPTVRIVSPKDRGTADKNVVTLDVELTDQGGGIQGPWLYVNGARVLAGGLTQRDGKILKRRFEAELTEGTNHLEVKAASADGSWESEPAILSIRYEKPLAKPDLYVVAVGVSDYVEGSYKLKYAKGDAEAIADLFQKRGRSLYADVHVTTLLDKDATADTIRRTMQTVTKKARPQDTLVLFLAGHGAMVGQRYYFIPHEVRIRPGKDRDDDVRDQALPADVLGEFLSLGPAQRRMLILDTCASGGAVDLFQVAARDGFAFRGDLERLSRSQGVYVLAAAAAGEEAKENEQLGHGVLTYTLLAGMGAVKKGPLERRSVQPSSPSQVVDVLEWLSFAEGHVRTLTEQLYGRSQNVHFVSRGGSFPVLPVRDP